jgi:gamma-glutamyltranspeptidase/glutathione hydrolase
MSLRNTLVAAACAVALASTTAGAVDLSPGTWPTAERADVERRLQNVATDSGVYADQPMAIGGHGAVTGTYSAPAIRAGLEALKQGGTSVDAALTTAITQVTLASSLWVSYAGLMSVVHYDAASGQVFSLNASFDTVRGETEPLTIPATDVLGFLSGGKVKPVPNGRQVLVPGFMRGVEAAHRRFGKLPFAALFGPAIYYAERGFVLSQYEVNFIDARRDALTRLPAGRARFLKRNGKPYVAGDTFRQPDLAGFLRAVASNGADHMYTGAWADRAIAAMQADGGKMTKEDLAGYRVIWQQPMRGTFREYEIVGNGLPAVGGLNTQEALNVYEASGLVGKGHYTKSGETLFWMTQIAELVNQSRLPPAEALALEQATGLKFDPTSRLSKAQAAQIWRLMNEKRLPFLSSYVAGTQHSDVVVAADAAGNMTAIVHSINGIGDHGLWVDGVGLNNAGGYQQRQLAAVGPGKRLPDPTTPMLVLKSGKPQFAAGSMSPGLHQKTIQSLVNLLDYGMSPKEAIDAPYFMLPALVPRPGVDMSKPLELKPGDLLPMHRVLKGSIDPAVLDDARRRGVALQEIELKDTRSAQGLFVLIDRDPATGAWRAAAPRVTNGVALAY